MLAFAMMAAIRQRTNTDEVAQKKPGDAACQTIDLIRWSIQEIRRIATRLARRRIPSSDVIAWSHWRRAHQAVARATHIRQKTQL